MARIPLKVNGKNQVVDVDPETPLLYVLRNDLNSLLRDGSEGCGQSSHHNGRRTGLDQKTSSLTEGLR